MRGRQFAFLGCMVAFWFGIRIGIIATTGNPNTAVAQPDEATFSVAQAALCKDCAPAVGQRYAAPIWNGKTGSIVNQAEFAIDRHNPGVIDDTPAISIHQAKVDAPIDTPGVPALLPLRRKPAPAWDIYAYSFIRAKSDPTGLSSSGQYGGSQSAFVATLALASRANADTAPSVALQFRGSLAHDNPVDREFSAGLRYKPMDRLPLTIALERRFRHQRGGAFAVYVAGGDTINLPWKSRLGGYAQAGYVSGEQATPFFDFTARLDRKIGKPPIRAGIGAWGGGQADIFRIDIGPTISDDFTISGQNFHASADWRIRIAGDAAPAHGPAVTLSTSF